MIIAQTILLLSVLFISIYFLRYRKTSKTKAFRKITVLLFMATAIIAILFPEFLTTIAHRIGIGRGTDLVLYVFVLTTIFQIFSASLKQRHDQIQLHKLARKVAIIEASQKYKNIPSGKRTN